MNVPGCLTGDQLTERQGLLSFAVQTFASVAPNASVYIDAGQGDDQIPPATIASQLTASGISNAAGFSLNVANYVSTADNTTYGQQVSALTNNKHFIIDTSRNGTATANGVWCNPPNQGAGTPTRRPQQRPDRRLPLGAESRHLRRRLRRHVRRRPVRSAAGLLAGRQRQLLTPTAVETGKLAAGSSRRATTSSAPFCAACVARWASSATDRSSAPPTRTDSLTTATVTRQQKHVISTAVSGQNLYFALSSLEPVYFLSSSAPRRKSFNERPSP